MTNIAQILEHLPTEKIKELETITSRITETGMAEIILLFGSYARGSYKEQRGKERGRKSDYDILVVTAPGTAKDMRAKLRDQFDDIEVPVQLVIENINTVNSHLSEKQYFYTDIKREGKILYTSGKYQLSEPEELSPGQRRKMAEEDFKMWYDMAMDFWIDSKPPLDRGNHRKASFELQQSVEMCYTAIEMVFAHYNPNEHNLQVLRKRAMQFDSRTGNAFPVNTDEEQELFEHLNYAYIGGRYRSSEEYPVTTAQLSYWSNETKKLLEITETICREHIEDL
jgi:uncharacterized protein